MTASLKLYNTLTRRLEPFQPMDPAGRRVTMYVCGPTVYDEPHLGHLRSAFVFDIARRLLAWLGHEVLFVRNVTDVDDKIIDKARQEQAKASKGPDLNALCGQISERYLAAYHAALRQLAIEPPTHEPRAMTHVVPEMTDLIAKLFIQGVAYEAKGNVYFAVRKFPGYGRLSNRTLEELQAGGRVEPGEGKQDPLDFALWKASKPGEPVWRSPWGEGRPGWHIECSAMSGKYLGDTFDIHGGGLDLVFPHHENEAAQSQAAGRPFARLWMHHGLLTVGGEKMSKSLKNFITVEQALKACRNEPDVLKTFFLSSHYRSPVDYTAEQLRGAEKRYRGWLHFLYFAQNRCGAGEPTVGLPHEVSEFAEAFRQAMLDDMNTPKALAALDQLTTLGYRWEHEARQATGDAERLLARRKLQASAATLKQLGQLLGLFQRLAPVALSTEQASRLTQREQARHRKDYGAADAIRKEFQAGGLTIEDTAEGPVVLPAA